MYRKPKSSVSESAQVPDVPVATLQKVNKSEEIRKVLARRKNAKPLEVVAILAEKGIETNAMLVSQVKATLKKRRSADPTAKTVIRRSPMEYVLDDLLQAKKYVDQVGSTEKALKALAAFVKLRS
jgi:hypothetical protein